MTRSFVPHEQLCDGAQCRPYDAGKVFAFGGLARFASVLKADEIS